MNCSVCGNECSSGGNHPSVPWHAMPEKRERVLELSRARIDAAIKYADEQEEKRRGRAA